MTNIEDKIKGCFLGKNIGGTLGMFNEGLEGYSNLTFYDPVPTEPVPNDDLDLQVIWLECMKKAGLALDNQRLGQAWLDHIDVHPDEYGVAIWNLKRGLKPPQTGIHNNWHTNGMGATIRSEIWACLFPGKPLTAAYYAYQDASVDHWGDGVLSEMFMAAVQSHLFESENLRTSLEFGLTLLPDSSRVKQAALDVMRIYDSGASYEEARDEIMRTWGSVNFADCIMNGAIIFLGLLYGEGNYEKSLLYAVNCGQDADCTGATTGGFLGILHGAEATPEKWKAPLGEKVVIGDYNGIACPADLNAMVKDITDLQASFTGKDLPEWAAPFELPENPDFSDVNPWLVNGEPVTFKGIHLEAEKYNQHVGKMVVLETNVRFPESGPVQIMAASRGLFTLEVDGQAMGTKGDLLLPVPAFHRVRGGRCYNLNVEADREYALKINLYPTVPVPDMFVSFGDMSNRHLTVSYRA